MSAPKLPVDAFHAQFHNHEQHLNAQDHARPFSHEIPDHPPAGENPDYSRKRKKHHPKKAVHKALHITVGR
jgi:hypothetical protein